MQDQARSTSLIKYDAAVVKVHIIQGEQYVTADPDVMITTLLGSCVAACMRDPVAGVGGMNHFLLPGDERYGGESLRHGVHAMELLVNALLSRGARRDRLEAKLFGGACMQRGLTDVGEMNASFASQFLARENIRSAGGSLRGDLGRRIQYWPILGRARQTFLRPLERAIFDRELQTPARSPAPDTGKLELF